MAGEKLKSLSAAQTSALDVTSQESIDAFKQSLGDEPVDILLNVAGAHGTRLQCS